ncbi:hypothetical protein O3G_MSEX011287 [Manduca sexta]|uniref:Reverse transcriptase domain-containing protein n=1 Tax=Manduca sexta TaxID=7130 RepID=A0A921ZK78_MANSE|nr:hypothetical protein O3G_MSEX011287 [Manduca sexta]
MESSRDLVDTHSILYCAAVAACRVANVKFPIGNKTTRVVATKPAWQHRIEKRINSAQTLIAKLIAFQGGNCRLRIMRFMVQAFSGTNINSQDYRLWITECIDFFKQKVYAWANRIRRYRKRWDRFQQNRTFQSDQKRVYRCWENSTQGVADGRLPSARDMHNYWTNIWSSPVSHTEASWFGVVDRACETIRAMEAISVSPVDVLAAIRPTQNWKAPGPDGLYNFWLKWFPSSHARLAAQFQNALDGGSLPTFMTTGVTHLLFKSGCTTDPKNYRPITCLPTIYKPLTSILRYKITNHFTTNNILFPGQTGCKIGSRGTKELLLIDMTICQQARHNRQNLSAAWIDYKKAYDSVPHTWLLRVLNLYKVGTNLCNLLGSCMGQWTTVLRYPGGLIPAECDEPIRIKRGIFQGDSLSPLWFCMALNPLSTLLLDSGLGYRLRRGSEPISHLLYMDDLKLFA